MSSSSKKQSALISGCSAGIGEATAKLLADKGWTVFAGVRKQTDADKLKSYSTNIQPVILDIGNVDQVREAVEQVRVAVGEDGLDALINNAGIAYGGPTEFMEIDDVQRQFDINVFGLIRLTQAAMSLIRMGKPGRVINISSIGAQQVAPMLGVYQGTKAAVEVISAAFRNEVAKWGIRVVLIRPGPVKSKFSDEVFAKHDENMKKFTPGTPCYTLYGKDLENVPNASKAYTDRAVDPKIVAGKIHTALTAKNPKYMYYDTWGSWLVVKIITWMPASWYDAMVRRIFMAKD